MSPNPSPSKDVQVVSLYTEFAKGGLSRREFMSRAAALGVAGAAAATVGSLATGTADAAGLAQTAVATSKKIPLDVAEWSYMWVNVRRAETARGAYVGGQQMYVEYMIPAQVKRPFPVVLVHGGGGQGTDWMETPDGRPGWFQYLGAGGLQGLRRRSARATGARRCIRISTAPSRPTTSRSKASPDDSRRPPPIRRRRRTSTRRTTTNGPVRATWDRRISISSLPVWAAATCRRRRLRARLRHGWVARARARGEPAGEAMRPRVRRSPRTRVPPVS